MSSWLHMYYSLSRWVRDCTCTTHWVHEFVTAHVLTTHDCTRTHTYSFWFIDAPDIHGHHTNVWTQSHAYATCLIHKWHHSYRRDVTRSHETWLIHTWNDTHSYVTKAYLSFIMPMGGVVFICNITFSYVTSRIHMQHHVFICDVTHSHWFTCDTTHLNLRMTPSHLLIHKYRCTGISRFECTFFFPFTFSFF